MYLICGINELFGYSNFDHLQIALSLYPFLKEILKIEATITHRGRYIGKRKNDFYDGAAAGIAQTRSAGTAF